MVKEEYGGNEASRIANAESLEAEQFRKIFIGGLASVTDEASLKNFYGRWGEVIDCVVMRDPQTKRSRGFGFISFTSMREVDAAMSDRPHEIDGKRVDPKRAVPREDSARGQKLPSTNRLYVSGVREGHTEEMFREYFGEFGKIAKVEIMMDKTTGKPRGFGFVSFEDYDPVDRCVLKKSHMINGYRCDVKKGLSKEEMAKVEQTGRDRAARGERNYGAGGARGNNSQHGWSGRSRDGAWESAGSAWSDGNRGFGGSSGSGGWDAPVARTNVYNHGPWATATPGGSYSGAAQSAQFGVGQAGYSGGYGANQSGPSSSYGNYAPPTFGAHSAASSSSYGVPQAASPWAGQSAPQDPWRRNY